MLLLLLSPLLDNINTRPFLLPCCCSGGANAAGANALDGATIVTLAVEFDLDFCVTFPGVDDETVIAPAADGAGDAERDRENESSRTNLFRADTPPLLLLVAAAAVEVGVDGGKPAFGVEQVL